MTLSSASSSVVRRTKDMTFLPQPLPLPSRRQKTSSTTTKASRSASKLKRSTTNSAAKSATEKKAHHHSAMGSVSAKEASQTGPALRHDKSITASTSKQSGKRDRSNSTDSMPPSAVSASNRATTQPFKTVSGSTTGSSAAIHPDSPFDPTNTALSTLESRPNKRQKLTQESVPGRTSPDASQVTAELQAGDSISQIAGKFDATSAPTETESPFDDKTSQNGGDADSLAESDGEVPGALTFQNLDACRKILAKPGLCNLCMFDAHHQDAHPAGKMAHCVPAAGLTAKNIRESAVDERLIGCEADLEIQNASTNCVWVCETCVGILNHADITVIPAEPVLFALEREWDPAKETAKVFLENFFVRNSGLVHCFQLIHTGKRPVALTARYGALMEVIYTVDSFPRRQWSVHCPYMEEFKDKSSAFRFVQPQYRPKQAATIMEANETMVIDYNPSDVQSEQHYQELVFMGPGANLQKHAWIIPYLDPLHALVYALDKTKFNRRIGDFSYEMLYLLQSIREKIAYATGFGKAKVYFQSQHVSRMAAEPHVKHLDTMDDPEEPETVAPSDDSSSMQSERQQRIELWRSKLVSL